MASLLAAAVVVAGSTRMYLDVCGLFHDDGIYVITAKSLAEGQGYQLANLPGSPPQTKYPILYPALLSFVWLMWPSFPDNLLAMQALSLLSCAAAVGLGYVYLVRHRYFPRNVAAAAGVLCATAPLFLYYSTQIMSEMPFALILVVTCWALDGALSKQPRGRAHEMCLGVLLTLPFWCRSIGIALVLCGLIAVRRAGRPIGWIAAGAAASIMPWAAWCFLGLAASHSDPSVAYYTDYLDWWSALGLPLLARVLLWNGADLTWSSLLGLEGCDTAIVALAKQPLLFPWCTAGYIVMLGLGSLAWLPFARQLRQGRVLPCCLSGYLLLVLVWPWPPDRFLVPIMLVLVAYMLLGTSWLAARLMSVGTLRVVGTVALGLAVAANLVCLSRYCRLSRLAGHSQNWIEYRTPHWHSYERLFDWIRASTAPSAVVAADGDPMFYLYTGRRGIRPFVGRPGAMFYDLDAPKLGTVEEFASTLSRHRAEYLVLTPMRFYDQPFAQLAHQLRARHPGWLRRVYQDPRDPRFAIYKLVGDPPALSSEPCG